MMHASPRHAKSAVKKMRNIHVPNLSQFSNKNFPIEDCVQSYLILFTPRPRYGDKTLWCSHSNKASLGELLRSAFYIL